MAARLERDEEDSAPSSLTRSADRGDLGVLVTGSLGATLADDLAIAHEHGANGWVRTTPAQRLTR